MTIEIGNEKNSPIIRIMQENELEDFLDLMEISFKESLETDRINLTEMRNIIKKSYKPFFKLMMKIMQVKMKNYVVELDGKMVSGISLSIEKDEGNIGNVMTHPDYRRKGFARTLFQLANKQAEESKIKKMDLSVNANNVGAIELYESEGFKRNYHSGVFEFKQIRKFSEVENYLVTIKEIKHIEFENMDKMLDDCFPSFYFETRNRKKFIKKYIPSKFIQAIAKRIAGQIIRTYGFFLNGDEQPRGYIQTSKSRAEENIRLNSPILLEKDNDLLIEAFPQLIKLES
ncbi:MAG: GNAT family N-acetyltransferase, partial [Asgard group archaeon]|nr:GNAT family N-acetyltransferase [Asgard group archaeon]